MIRKASELDFCSIVDDECAIRIHSLKRAYGLDVPFIRYYSDECGGLLSVMDGVGVLCCTENVDEWLIFITMNPEIIRLHCSATVGRKLAESNEWQGREGVVLKYTGDGDVSPSVVCENPYLPHVHALLSECFDEMPKLDAWYPDASHRIRHDCAKIATVLNGEKAVSTAMTVAEIESAAIIGQVATHRDFRSRGYAKMCINSLILRCKGKKLYILPMTNFARSIYENMGFSPIDEWMELQRI